MKKLNIIHLGIGNVGRALVRMILENKEKLKKDLKVDLNYCGLFNSKGGIYKNNGLKEKEINHFPGILEANVEEAIVDIKPPFLLVDTTASDETFPYLISALKNDGGVVLSNKKPLSSSQDKFDELHKLAQGKLFYETTVGAALPVISTLKSLLFTGDEIIEIKGCFSGTLGYLFSCLEAGNKFSETVLAAKQKGYTEPDPRDDLSGVDVARKALILSRIIGRKLELTDVALESLYPSYIYIDKLTIEEFLTEAENLDGMYQKKLKEANKEGKTIRYVASLDKRNCRVGMELVPIESDLGRLKGPDNMIIFKTERYLERPMVIKGPGAGVEVTAAGVFGDILKITGKV